jgi:hypothetical protein
MYRGRRSSRPPGNAGPLELIPETDDGDWSPPIEIIFNLVKY